MEGGMDRGYARSPFYTKPKTKKIGFDPFIHPERNPFHRARYFPAMISC